MSEEELKVFFDACENYKYKKTHKLLPHKIKAMNEIEKCRTEELGYHKDVCDECRYEKISYNSCRNRHCPKCQSIAREKWIYNSTFFSTTIFKFSNV